MVEPGLEPRQPSARVCVLSPTAFPSLKKERGSRSHVWCAAVALPKRNETTLIQRGSRDLTEALGGSSLRSHILLPSPWPGPFLPRALHCYSSHSAVPRTPLLSFRPHSCGVGAVCTQHFPAPFISLLSPDVLHISLTCTSPLQATSLLPVFLKVHTPCPGKHGHSGRQAALSEIGKGCQAEKQRRNLSSQTGGRVFARFPHVGHWKACQPTASYDNRRHGEDGLGTKPCPLCQAPNQTSPRLCII